MKHILGSCVLAGLFLFCACDDTLDTKVTWQIGDSDTWRVPELAQGVLYKAYNGIANRPDCFEDNFLDCATDNAVTNLRSSSVYKLNMGGMTAFNNPIGNWSNAYNMLNYVNSFLENGLTDLFCSIAGSSCPRQILNGFFQIRNQTIHDNVSICFTQINVRTICIGCFKLHGNISVSTD